MDIEDEIRSRAVQIGNGTKSCCGASRYEGLSGRVAVTWKKDNLRSCAGDPDGSYRRLHGSCPGIDVGYW